MIDRDDRVLVIGGGVAGLVTALDLARAGLRPIVLEAGESCGGVLSSHRVAGLTLDAGAESFATGRPAVGELVARLGLTDRVAEPNPVGAWVRFVGGAAPLPATSLLGIPGHPTAPDVRRVIGLAGVLRSRADALLPARIGAGDGTSLGGLVRTRMGRRVLERLVEPVAGGVYATDPAELEVASISPGLPQALIDTGSLAGAARRLRGGGQRSGSAVATLSGGLHTLVTSLVEAVVAAGGQIRTGQSVDSLVRDGSGWRVDAGGESLSASRVVLALPAPGTGHLLETAIPEGSTDVMEAPITRVAIVTLVIDDRPWAKVDAQQIAGVGQCRRPQLVAGGDVRTVAPTVGQPQDVASGSGELGQPRPFRGGVGQRLGPHLIHPGRDQHTGAAGSGIQPVVVDDQRDDRDPGDGCIQKVRGRLRDRRRQQVPRRRGRQGEHHPGRRQ